MEGHALKRRCRYEPLSAQPLVLVLCQVRFSRVQIERYIPAIQETFRRNGFPIERANTVHQVAFAPGGGPPAVSESKRWDYRNREETWSILVMEDSVTLQTTDYSRFEEFAERLQIAVHTVLTASEHDRHGVVDRVGLRYIDVVRTSGDRDFRFYLRPGLHGVSDEAYDPYQHLIHIQHIGSTVLDDAPGTMIIRVVQNNEGQLLTPDLLAAAPKLPSEPLHGDLVTLIDMDHFVEGTFDPDAGWVVARAYELHDHIIETFHDHVVTAEAIEEWR